MSGMTETTGKFIGRGVGATAITDGKNFARIDRTSGMLDTLDALHTRIHDGKVWIAAHAETIAQNKSIDLLIVSGLNGTQSHVVFEYGTAALGRYELYENPTVSVQGSVLPHYNKNRKSTTYVAMSTVYINPTFSALGTRIDIASWGTKQAGQYNRDAEEWILDNAKTYLMRVVQVDTGSASVTAKIEWYEEALADQLEIV